jgi:hypothetical protein
VELAKEGSSHFKNIFKADSRATIDTILQVASLFPSFIDQEGNVNLMAKVTKDELWRTLKIFQNDKFLGPDGLTVKFYMGCFDFNGEDLLKMVEYSRTSRQILAPFNATFISLIPKSDNPHSFH